MRKTSACGFVQNEGGEILLHRRADNGRWGLPGGGIELDETAEQAVVREVLEETGFQVEARRLIGVYSKPELTTVVYPGGAAVTYVALTFECRLLGGSPALSEETLEVGWFAADSLPESVSAGHLQRIRDGLAGELAAFVR